MESKWKLLSAGVLAAGLLAAFPAGASGEALAQQESSERGVTLRVAPRDLSSTATVWDFEIVLQTHSQNLADDLKAMSTLVADGRTRQAPTAWDGDPPGGHHRKGVLRFAPVAPQPQMIELQILRPGEDSPRSFQWQMK